MASDADSHLSGRRYLPDRYSGSTISTAIEHYDTDSTFTPVSHDGDMDRVPTSNESNHFDSRSVEEIFDAIHAEMKRRSTDQDVTKGKHTSRHLSSTNSISETEQRDSSNHLEEEKASSPGPSSAVGFWHADLARTRKQVLIKYCSTLLILCASIFVILSIYWGVLFNVKRLMPNVTVVVISFEGLAPYQNYAPIVGPFVRAACEAEIRGRDDHLGYVFHEPSMYHNDPTNVRLAVYNQDIWAAIIVNSNATALLRQAVETGNTSYDPRGAASIVYNQARDVESYNFHIVPFLDRLVLDITTSFATSWAQQVLTNKSLDPAIYSRAPQTISPGISFTSLNLRPFDPPAAIPTITIGLIYLIIIAFFSFTFFIPTHMKFVTPNLLSPHPLLKFPQLVIYRWLATITAYFLLALAYSLVSLAFRIPFSNTPPPGQSSWSLTEPVVNANPYGNGTWPMYFLLNFTGMAALGLTCENMAMFLSALSPLPYSALFLIWWVITNVSTGFYALELASDFYRWGYAWPLRHIVMGSKTLVFGTKNELGLNFGVLIAWVAVGTVMFPAACWVLRWNGMRTKKKAAVMEQRI